MYRLEHLILVNWHNFEPLELPFSRCTAVIGENRSGKSTLLDAMQVALLGNHGQWRELNRAAADERSRRTVRSYCLGVVAPNQPPLRNSSVTWVGLHFRDDETGHDCSIGVHLTASTEETSERTSHFLLRGEQLRLSDLVDEIRENGEVLLEPLDWESAMHRLERRTAGRPGASLTTPLGPERYMGEWMKAMNAGGRSPQPRILAKAFVNAVAYRQVDSDDQFFKRFLLPDRPINIEQLRMAIATYREVDGRIKDIRREIALLAEAGRESRRYLEALAAAEMEGWMAARAEAQQAWRVLRRNRVKRADKLAEAQAAQDELARAESDLGEARSAREGIQAKITQSSAGQLHQIDLEEREARTKREEAIRQLTEWFSKCRDAASVSRRGLLVGASSLAALETRLAALSELNGTEAATFPKDARRLTKLLGEFDDMGPAIAHLEQVARRAYVRYERAEENRSDAQGKLQRLEAGHAPIGQDTTDFLDALRAEGLDPQVLCSLVSVTDESWRDAAEALLGPEREAIILAPEQVEPAIRFWRAQRDRFRRCRIARTDKVTPETQPPRPGTLASIVVSEDPLVAGFLRRRIGDVRLAETVEDLRAPGRAIMRDRFFDDGLSVRRIELRGLPLLGREIGETAKSQLSGEIARLAAEARDAMKEGREHAASADVLKALAEAIRGERRPIDELDDARARAEARLEELLAQRREVESSINPDWTKEVERLGTLISSLEQTCRDATKEAAEARAAAEEAGKALGAGEDFLGSAACFRIRLLHLRQAEARVPTAASAGLPGRPEVRRQFRDRMRRAKDEPKLVGHDAQQARKQKMATAENAKDAFWTRVEEYRRRTANPQAEHLQSTRMSVAEADAWIRDRVGYLEGHALLEHEEQMERASREMTKVFQTDFVAAVRDRMEIVRQEVDRITTILRPHRFHQERYRFRHQVAPAYQGVIELAQLAADDPRHLMSLFDDADEADQGRHAPAIESVKELLLSDALDASVFEDYRNYWTFWLESAPVDTDRWVSFQSRKGINSGAESQTPFYIAMAAALAAAYRGGREPRQGGMGLALFDEAFSKMDPNNQRRMLDFFLAVGLQPVVAAPLSGQTALVSRMDRIHEVWRSGDHAQVESYAPGQELKDAIEREDPSRLSREELLEIAQREEHIAVERPVAPSAHDGGAEASEEAFVASGAGE